MKSGTKTRAKSRRKGPNDDKTSWMRLPKTTSGRQRKIQYYVDDEMATRMEKVAPLLIELENKKEGEGITRNTPGMFSEYCAKVVVKSLEDILMKIAEMQNVGEIDAVSPTAHNTR